MSEPKERPNLLRYSSAGVEFICTFGLMLGAGILLDRRMGTRVGWTLLGGVAGFFAGLYRLVKQAQEIRSKVSKQDDRTGRRRPE